MSSVTAIRPGKHTKPVSWFVWMYERFCGGGTSLQSPFLLAANMFVAYWTADRGALVSVFSDPGKFYGADPYTFLFASLLVLVFGAGFFSLDAAIAKRWRKRA